MSPFVHGANDNNFVRFRQKTGEDVKQLLAVMVCAV